MNDADGDKRQIIQKLQEQVEYLIEKCKIVEEIAGLRNYRDCSHPNLLRIRHIEITPEFLFYTMDAADDLHHGSGDYLPDTLSNRLRQFKRLDGGEIFAMLTGLLDGLSELHRNHLVHRDLKPDNILWVNGRPTLADAGLIAPTGQLRLYNWRFFAEGMCVYCYKQGNGIIVLSFYYYNLSFNSYKHRI